MSDPNDPRENHLKGKFEELPDQVTIADHPRNKQININLNLRMAVASI